MSDPRFPDFKDHRRSEPEPNRLVPLPSEQNGRWGWFVGAALAIAALVLILGYRMTGDDTASVTPPPPATTTGSSSTVTGSGAATPAPTAAPRPATPAPADK